MKRIIDRFLGNIDIVWSVLVGVATLAKNGELVFTLIMVGVALGVRAYVRVFNYEKMMGNIIVRAVKEATYEELHDQSEKE